MLFNFKMGFVALILASTMAAFTTRETSHMDATHVFEFDPSLTYTINNVKATSNWQYLGEISSFPLCNGANKACRIVVTDDYVDDPLDPTQLSGISISASLSSGGKAVVTAITDPYSNGFSNQP